VTNEIGTRVAPLRACLPRVFTRLPAAVGVVGACAGMPGASAAALGGLPPRLLRRQGRRGLVRRKTGTHARAPQSRASRLRARRTHRAAASLPACCSACSGAAGASDAAEKSNGTSSRVVGGTAAAAGLCAADAATSASTIISLPAPRKTPKEFVCCIFCALT
jgi:hypothetical protein